ncbi:MAG TPA: hypothetical protein VJJ20_01695 [Candidatus Paceibacterota bacterium]
MGSILNLFGPNAVELPEFKPCCLAIEALDLLIYLHKDCSYRSRQVKGTNMDLLLDPYSDEVVGMQIWGYSRLLLPPTPLDKAA